MSETETSGWDLRGLLSILNRSTALTGVADLLESLSESLNAFGCILWELPPGGGARVSENGRDLFVWAYWFPGDAGRTVHRAPLYGSISGKCLREQVSISVPDIATEEGVFSDTFLRENGIQALCATPVNLQNDRGTVLTAYRKGPKPFGEAEVRTLEEAAEIFPLLYGLLSERVGLELATQVSEILQSTERAVGTPSQPRVGPKRPLKRIASAVSQTLNCVETSIFLKNPAVHPGEFKLYGTTWPGHFARKTYQHQEADSLTGWVLDNNSPVRVFDLLNFQRDRDFIQANYPDISWKPRRNFSRTIRKELGLEDGEELPPQSFMAAPISTGKEVLGVIRCCSARRGPYQFGPDEFTILQLVAHQAAQFWQRWIKVSELDVEVAVWSALVRDFSDLNHFVRDALDSEVPDGDSLIGKILELMANAIPTADNLDARLLNDTGKALGFRATLGPGWSEGTRAARDSRLYRTFPVDADAAPSVGKTIFETRQTCVINDVTKIENFSATFPNTKKLISAPILVGDRFYGVLDARSSSEEPFPRHAGLIATLLGYQLGLYHSLATSARELQTANQMIQQQAALEQSAFKDQRHQLIGPLQQICERTRDLLSLPDIDEHTSKEVRKVLGMARKAREVARSIGLFADLAGGHPITLNRELLPSFSLIPLLIGLAEDNELSAHHDIRIHVNRESFDHPAFGDFMVDYNLFLQIVNNLLDNACKYSYPGTKVVVEGGVTGSDRIHITVFNKGITLLGHEVRHAKEKHWRSESAISVTAEGEGIGLYIVHEIMKAMSGELIVVPTTQKGITEVKLVFPRSRNR